MAFLGQEEQVRELQDRFRFVYIALFIGLGFLLSRLVYLQILNGEKMRHFSEENRIKRVKIAAPRGMILDRKRRILIDNHPAFDLEIIPQYFYGNQDSKRVIELLASLIHMKPREIEDILKKHRHQPRFLPVKVKTDLTRDEVAVLESWKIDMPGVQVQEEIKRTNIYGDVASHLLGYIGEVSQSELPRLLKEGKEYKLGDAIGKFGLEQRLEDTLRGIDGERLVEVDALGRTKLEKGRGRVLAAELEKAAVPGKNLVLTIDQDLQLAARDAFAEKIGAVVAIEPKTGRILSMVSRPSFDPTQFSRGIPTALWNQLVNNEHRPLRDKTIQDHYPPGSTFKVVTAITGLEEGIIDANTTFNCPGKIKFGNRTYHCHLKQGHGNVNVVQALARSCDVFFYRVAQKLKSVDDIAKWSYHLGLGKKTGINLAREVPGLIPTEKWKQDRYNQPWNQGETLSIAIGQGYLLTTALQLANLYASIANGGTLFRPYMIEQVESFEGQVLKTFKPEALDQTRLKESTNELIRQGLYGVVNQPGATAYWQRIPGMDMVGKTGTVQVIRLSADKIYQKCQNMRFRDRHHGMFAGYAPADDPRIAVAVFVEHGCSGSGAAAPIARAVIKTYLEKNFPDEFGPKVIAEKLKKLGIANYFPPGTKPPVLEDEEVVANDGDELLPGGGTTSSAMPVLPARPAVPVSPGDLDE